MKQTSEHSTLKPVATKYVYDALKEKILSFEIYPGSRVTESELADLFMVSRTPVREALLRLENEGFLTIRPKQGCFIKQINIEELSEYYGVRTALETAAVEGACHYMPESELQQLLSLWSPAQEIIQHNADQMEDKDESFHISLALGSGNSTLAKYLQDVNDHIRIIRRVDFQNEERIRRTYQEHHAIIESILHREVDKARNLMKRHIQRSQDFAKTLTLTQLAKKKANMNFFDQS
ncbi:MAG: GntR family transcriptional regulator [Halothiobacillus sp. 20-54-6]|nr:MAG: GntR family transcriptional regulator [Halothiobacillus sp. 20-54-6]